MKLLVLAPAVLSVGVLLAQQPASDVTRNPLATNPIAVADGQRVYNQTCQSCHGPAGQGDRAPALTTTRFVHGNDDADVFHTIRSGIPGTQMPPFGGLSDEQIWQLVTYIAACRARAPSGMPGPESRRRPTDEMPRRVRRCSSAKGRLRRLPRGERDAAALPIRSVDRRYSARLSPATVRQTIIDPSMPGVERPP